MNQTTTDQSAWALVEPTIESALQQIEYPLEALASGAIPAIVLRNAWSTDNCSQLVQRLTDEGLIYDPSQPIPEHLKSEIIPEGYFREGNKEFSQAMGEREPEHIRIDVGTSLGYRGSDPDGFFRHSVETQALFDRLFANAPNPIELLYNKLEELSRNKRVLTAYEPDGRKYGPAIIRAHYGGYAYKPHFDSVRLREKRDNFAVYNCQHQFAGVLVLQNTEVGDQSAQGRLHRCLWEPEVDPYLKKGKFDDYAQQHSVEHVDVCLQPGDLYFFNTRLIHEVPGVAGRLPRIVLATFIGYSSDSDEVLVWS